MPPKNSDFRPSFASTCVTFDLSLCSHARSFLCLCATSGYVNCTVQGVSRAFRDTRELKFQLLSSGDGVEADRQGVTQRRPQAVP